MKKQYKVLLWFLAIEILVVSLLNEMGIKVHSWAGNAIGTFLFLLPAQVLLFLMGRDEQFSEKKRTCVKVAFWFILVCYVLGGIAALV